jgi:hypothetical protein
MGVFSLESKKEVKGLKFHFGEILVFVGSSRSARRALAWRVGKGGRGKWTWGLFALSSNNAAVVSLLFIQ